MRKSHVALAGLGLTAASVILVAMA